MRGLPYEDTSYSGSDSHRFVDALIMESGNLDVVSPYISAGYARMLSEHASRYRVRVVTSGMDQNEPALSEFGHSRAYQKWLKGALFFLLLTALAGALGLYYALAVLAPVTVLLAFGASLFARRRQGNLRVKVANRVFVHEKLYLCDRVAITGSANLTFSGMHRNVEHLDIAVSRERVEALREHFEELWSSL